ncbi:hypothetical protein FOMPIDRAFT_92790 [Fomitopsis schrenkii]|uniref:Uncharacterized protein n=1 Tax=Fomitopsis schrenkii TaxID=2126942 RepID=S8DRH4_FOMSC|nr:hypothetical protein FOMPIDRAFT_92790 [Fomitopsis schrenkii]
MDYGYDHPSSWNSFNYNYAQRVPFHDALGGETDRFRDCVFETHTNQGPAQTTQDDGFMTAAQFIEKYRNDFPDGFEPWLVDNVEVEPSGMYSQELLELTEPTGFSAEETQVFNSYPVPLNTSTFNQSLPTFIAAPAYAPQAALTGVEPARPFELASTSQLGWSYGAEYPETEFDASISVSGTGGDFPSIIEPWLADNVEVEPSGTYSLESLGPTEPTWSLPEATQATQAFDFYPAPFGTPNQPIPTFITASVHAPLSTGAELPQFLELAPNTQFGWSSRLENPETASEPHLETGLSEAPAPRDASPSTPQPHPARQITPNPASQAPYPPPQWVVSNPENHLGLAAYRRIGQTDFWVIDAPEPYEDNLLQACDVASCQRRFVGKMGFACHDWRTHKRIRYRCPRCQRDYVRPETMHIHLKRSVACEQSVVGQLRFVYGKDAVPDVLELQHHEFLLDFAIMRGESQAVRFAEPTVTNH